MNKKIPKDTLDDIREAVERAKKMWDNIEQEKPKDKGLKEFEEAYKRAMDII